MAGGAVAGAGVAYAGHRYFNTTSFFFNTVHAESLPSDSQAALKKVQWKGFTELKLESAEMVNHNVRRLTFALPDDQSVTGLPPISRWLCSMTIQTLPWTNPSCSISTHQAYA